MLERVVATRQLWRWVPPWRYGLGLLMRHVCNILIYHPAKSQYSIMIWRCCSRPWMQRGSAPQESENINTQGWISLNVFTRNASNKSNLDGMHSLYSQPWQYPQRWDFDVTSIKQLECFVHYIKSQENTAFLLRNADQQLIYNTRTGKACTISLEKSRFNFIYDELQKQDKWLHLAIEIELLPEISVITRHCNNLLVDDNKLWSHGVMITLLDLHSS